MGTKNAKFVNDTNLGITMALWLASDGYDHNPEDAPTDGCPIISATTLLKPTRSLILSSRAQARPGAETALSSLGSSRMGQAIHDSIENSFYHPKAGERLIALGFAESMVKRIAINPDPEDLAANPKLIPIYLEKRAYRKIRTRSGIDIWISGKFDQVIAGAVEDNKSTKAYSYCHMDQSEESNYAKQQSIYRWLSPEIITSEMGKINFILTDWKQSDVGRINNYPPKQVVEKALNLMSLEDTEAFILDKLEEIEVNDGKPELEMILCSDEELWRTPDKHKYYSNPETAKKGGRSSKNFDTILEAQNYRASKGKGVVVTVPGEVRRCNYCDGLALCSQRLSFM